jgi:hypothetical protein
MADFSVTHEVTFRVQGQSSGDALTKLSMWVTSVGGSILLQNPEKLVAPGTWDVTLIVSLPAVSTTLAGALTIGAGQYTAFPAGVSVRTLVQGAMRRADIMAKIGGDIAIA